MKTQNEQIINEMDATTIQYMVEMLNTIHPHNPINNVKSELITRMEKLSDKYGGYGLDTIAHVFANSNMGI